VIDPADELTPWKYSYTRTNSVNFTAMTVGIISAALGAILKLPAKENFIYSTAVTIVSSYIPTVYTKTVRYYKNVVGTTIVAGIKDYKMVFEHSNFTGLINRTIEIDCATGFYCGS
jgi:putative Mn2+ efflux pump MntP